MGLDMYLNKYPRYKNVTATQIDTIDSYFDWIKSKESGSEYANCTFKEWCGRDLSELPSIDAIEFYRQFYTHKYQEWDTEHKYGYATIHQQVGYWRKANSIHDWFVNHVQNGEDDCRYHQEVTQGVLYDLLIACETVLEASELTEGEYQCGYNYSGGERVPNIVYGKYVKDTSVAEKLLPTTCGFFFGSTEYDEYYIEDIKGTIDIIHKVLETTDFNKEMLFYVSSW